MVMIWKKIPVGRVAVLPLAAAVLILAGFLGFWKVRYDAGHEAQGQARDELWAVPAKYAEEEPKQAGTVEEIVYDTKAYATDEPLNKTCVDPRFGYVKRGCAPKTTDLNGKWAVPGIGYGESINSIVLEVIG